MWIDNDDRIMEILDYIEKPSKECFPVTFPICGKREGHLYFHRSMQGNARGGMWTWCSACRHSAHATYRVPKFWENLKDINFAILASHPDYLEEKKNCIDEWNNKLIFKR